MNKREFIERLIGIGKAVVAYKVMQVEKEGKPYTFETETMKGITFKIEGGNLMATLNREEMRRGRND